MDQLYIDQVIHKWHRDLIQKLPQIKEAYETHKHILDIINEFENTFLFEGAEEYFDRLVPRESETVLAHNDAQENNILASHYDATNVIFIDFEYTSWNPRAMDIANYFNETMLDNAHPVDNGIKCYLQNFIKESEQDFLFRRYLEHYY